MELWAPLLCSELAFGELSWWRNMWVCEAQTLKLHLFFSFLSFPVVQQPKSGLGSLTVQGSRLHTSRHTHTHTNTPSRKPLSMWSARHRGRNLQNTHKRRISMPWAGFEPQFPNRSAADLRLKLHVGIPDTSLALQKCSVLCLWKNLILNVSISLKLQAFWQLKFLPFLVRPLQPTCRCGGFVLRLVTLTHTPTW